MIFDCFPFFKELDLLEMRLAILDAYVDRFVLCEAPYTFRGVPKPLYYAENKARFARWNDRITHLVYDEEPRDDPWINDWRQRAYLTNGLAGAAPDDYVIVSDLDEIPAPANVARRPAPGRILAHRQAAARGYFNRISDEPWVGTRACAFRDLRHRSLNDIRFVRWGDELEYVDGGWHFTSLGGAAVIEEKFGALAHFEADIRYFRDRMRLDVEFATESGARWVPFDDAFPVELHDERWARYVWPKPETVAPHDVASLLHAHACMAYVPPDVTIAATTGDDVAPAWERAGAQRFGRAFAGCVARAADLPARLPPGGWAVIDGLERVPVATLATLASARIHVVAYANNARSFAAVDAVMRGARFPSGRALGLAELEQRIVAAGYAVAERDLVGGALAFPPSALPDVEPFGLDVGSLRFAATTRAALDAFVAHGVVFVLRPPAG